MSNTTRLCLQRLAAAAALACAMAPACAHDTWFERLSGTRGAALLALGTGNQFPGRETGVGAEYLVQQGCQTSADQPAVASPPALTPVRNTPAALLLRAPAGAQGCWIQMSPFDIELPPDKVALYLDELNASASLRATWAALQVRGLPWRERYTKHARIELLPGGAATPVAMGMDALLQRSGGQLVFTLLRDGQPLPDLAVELRGTAPGASAWHRTDSQGQLRLDEPPPGRWLLRTIDLRLAPDANDRWDSRFLTLAFDVSR